MKTPEEIKADAATCLTKPPHAMCDRFDLNQKCKGDCSYVIKELYDLVLHYESRLAQAERERDAAVEDIERFFVSPEVCMHYKYCQSVTDDPSHGCLGPMDCMDCKYRGLCEENTHDQPRM